MALVVRHSILRRLQTEVPRGAPVESAQLAALGVSPALAHHYLKSGWLSRLGRGVFRFPNDNLRQADCLRFLARQVEGFHVGGKTALAWRGFGHNVPAREPLWLWGERNLRLPDWFAERFPARYTTRTPFAPSLPVGKGLEPLPDQPDGVPVSVPERALLEMLSDVGICQGVEEARNLMEGVRSLRPEVVTSFLQHCQRVKVARLCVQWAEELQLPWAETARRAAARHLTGTRWSARLKNGTRLNLPSFLGATIAAAGNLLVQTRSLMKEAQPTAPTSSQLYAAKLEVTLRPTIEIRPGPGGAVADDLVELDSTSR